MQHKACESSVLLWETVVSSSTYFFLRIPLLICPFSYQQTFALAWFTAIMNTAAISVSADVVWWTYAFMFSWDSYGSWCRCMLALVCIANSFPKWSNQVYIHQEIISFYCFMFVTTLGINNPCNF